MSAMQPVPVDASTPPPRGAAGRWALGLYAAAVLLSAVLIFQVQPILARFILPWFGGGSAVWTATQLFFQTGLLVGYAYAHLLAARLRPRWQGALHLGLIAVALLALPIVPDEAWRPDDAADPTWRILGLLTVTVGLPYAVLSATGPLLQWWFAREFPRRDPYPLYALSNGGSLLGLVAYPLLVERLLGLRAQAWAWSGGFVIFCLGCAVLAARQLRRSRDTHGAAFDVAPTSGDARATRGAVALWALLPACATALSLSITTQLTQDVAAIPLLWVVPLAIYLLTFILAFSGDRWYAPEVYLGGLVLAAAIGVALLYGELLAIPVQVAAYSFVLFVIALCLHGELARLRPPARGLTAFYLTVAAGGAVGGLFVAVVAPLVLPSYWEYHVALAGSVALVAIARARDERERARAGRRTTLLLLPRSAAARRLALGAVGVLALAGLGALVRDARAEATGVIRLERSFYGVVRTFRFADGTPDAQVVMMHGRILHGFQYTAPDRRDWKSGYYSPGSGAGLAFAAVPGGNREVGVIGLGAGMLGPYAERGDHWRFYEINPQVTDAAEHSFTYLADARARGATVEVVHGDGRRLVERDLGRNAARLDLLVVDAFSSDSVPVHLLTEEAFAVYWQRLKPGGVLAVNISNRHLDLSGVVRGAAERSGRQALLVQEPADASRGVIANTWVLVAAEPRTLDAVRGAASVVPWPDAPMPRWTDDYSNLVPLLRLRGSTAQ